MHASDEQEFAAALRASDRVAAIGAVLAGLALVVYVVPGRADEPLSWVLRFVGLVAATVACILAKRACRIAPGCLAKYVRVVALAILLFDALVFVLALLMALTLEHATKVGVGVFIDVFSAFE